jgi:CheY-like chemotaxis protein/nitrogen-specific signal transduction histidine kinase
MKLKETSGEFNYIGHLFEENQNQKQQLVQAKDKAEESDKLKSSFLTNISHEIRTPMNAIIGFSDLLNDTDNDEPTRQEYINIITNSGRNLVSIIDDLIEMSKIDANQIKPNFKSINLETSITEIYNAIQISIPRDKRVVFNLIPCHKPLTTNILTDEVKWRQIMVNLINNALKFTVEGYVSFGYEVDEETSTINFTVNDSGFGIKEEFLHFIFDRFRRVENDFSISISGLGLGLAISKAFAELMGGTIRVQSCVGVGSTFTLTLPLKFDDTNDHSLQADNHEIIVNAAQALILVAEDENINYLLIEKMILSQNHKIIRATNGQEAVEICKKNPEIDLVLMDIKMPLMNGYEALAKIRVLRPDLPVIAQTAYSSIEEEEKIKFAGFVGYISKPLQREKLFFMINDVLQHSDKGVKTNI